jgi:hypothetical protein
MLARASEALAPPAAEAPAPLAITVESFPGLCMGASMLTSLALNKIGYDALSEKEGEALTTALLKNAMAWDLSSVLESPRAAAAVDLAGCVIAILVPRIIAESKRRPATELQAAVAERDAVAAAA